MRAVAPVAGQSLEEGPEVGARREGRCGGRTARPSPRPSCGCRPPRARWPSRWRSCAWRSPRLRSPSRSRRWVDRAVSSGSTASAGCTNRAAAARPAWGVRPIRRARSALDRMGCTGRRRGDARSVMITAWPSRDRTPDVAQLIDAGRDREAAEEGVRSASTGGTMDPLTQLEQLGPHLGGVVAGITPDQLDNPTPCDDFTVRGVLEHMIGGATAFAAAYRGEEPKDPDLSDPARRLRPRARRPRGRDQRTGRARPDGRRPVRRGARRDVRPLHRPRRARARLGHGHGHRSALRARPTSSSPPPTPSPTRPSTRCATARPSPPRPSRPPTPHPSNAWPPTRAARPDPTRVADRARYGRRRRESHDHHLDP